MSKKEYLKNKNGGKKRDVSTIVRGDVIYADLRGAEGSEQQNTRPCLVIQNNKGNKYSSTIIILPIGNKKNRGKDKNGKDKEKKLLPTQVEIHRNMLISGYVEGTVLCEQVRTIDKLRVTETGLAKFSNDAMDMVAKAFSISTGM